MGHRHSAMGQRYGAGVPIGTALWAMGQRYGAGGPSEPIGTVLWGSAMGQGVPLIP